MRAYLVLGLLCASLAGSVYIMHLRLDATREKLAQAQSDVIAYRDKSEQESAMRQEIADSSKTELGKLQDEKDSIAEQLARSRGLRINATCPDMPRDTAAGSVVHDTGPRLDDSTIRNYWVLRERIVEITAMLEGCQAYARIVAHKKARD